MTSVSRTREREDNGEPEISEEEGDRFIVKIAQYLQGSIGEKGWSEELVRGAFEDAVKTMPKGRARRELQDKFDEYADKLCDIIYRNNGPSIELTKSERKIQKWSNDPKTEWYALKQPVLENLESATLDELCVELDYSLKRAVFDIPAYVFMRAMEVSDMKPQEIASAEEIREKVLRRILDVARAAKRAWDSKSKKNQEEYEKLNNLIGRLAGATAHRRKMQGAREATAKMAAEIVLLRHDYRKVALAGDSGLRLPEHEVNVTASHDGTILLGNYRGDFAALLAERLPEDDNDLSVAFTEVDFPLFECALGLGGFDADFEKRAKKAGMLFGMLDIDSTDLKAITKNVGPSLLRRPPKAPFDAHKDVNDYDMEAFARTTKQSVSDLLLESMDAVEYTDTDYLHEALSMSGKEEDENSGPGQVKQYFALIRVARAYIKLLNAGGKRKKSSAVARYMSVAPAPEVLLMHVPDECGVDNTDARATSVELVVATTKTLQTIVNEWNEMRALFKSAAQSEGGFFIDVNREVGGAARLTYEAGEGENGNDIDEETEAELMSMLDKMEGPDALSDEDASEDADESE